MMKYPEEFQTVWKMVGAITLIVITYYCIFRRKR